MNQLAHTHSDAQSWTTQRHRVNRTGCRIAVALLGLGLLVGSGLMCVPEARAQVLEPEALQRKRVDQERARRMARELIVGVLEIQLRQLEENGLQELPIYREIGLMREHIGELIDTEMAQVVDKLAAAQRLPVADREAAFVDARQMIRAIIIRLTTERHQLLRRLKVAELAEQTRRLIRVQSAVQTATKQLPTESRARQESLAIKLVEDQEDVRELFLLLVESLADSRTLGGPVATGATQGLVHLKSAEAGLHVEQARIDLKELKFATAATHQEAVLGALRELLRLLEQSQAGDANVAASARDALRNLAERQRQLREETRQLDPQQTASDRLVNEQGALQKEIAQLKDSLQSLPAAQTNPLTQAAAAAQRATERLFDTRNADALQEQTQVLGHLAALEQALANQASNSPKDRSAADVAAQLKTLNTTRDQLQAARDKQREASQAAQDQPANAQPLQQQVTAAVAAAEQARPDLPTAAVERIEAARLASQAAAEQLATTNPPSVRESMKNAEVALDKALAALDLSVQETQRQATALAIGELARASEVLERAAAEERAIANAASKASQSTDANPAANPSSSPTSPSGSSPTSDSPNSSPTKNPATASKPSSNQSASNPQASKPSATDPAASPNKPSSATPSDAGAASPNTSAANLSALAERQAAVIAVAQQTAMGLQSLSPASSEATRAAIETAGRAAENLKAAAALAQSAAANSASNSDAANNNANPTGSDSANSATPKTPNKTSSGAPNSGTPKPTDNVPSTEASPSAPPPRNNPAKSNSGHAAKPSTAAETPAGVAAERASENAHDAADQLAATAKALRAEINNLAEKLAQASAQQAAGVGETRSAAERIAQATPRAGEQNSATPPMAQKAQQLQSLAAPALRADLAAGEAVESAQQAAQQAGHADLNRDQMEGFAKQAEKQLDRAIANLAAREQQWKQDEALARAIAGLADDQQQAAAAINQAAQELARQAAQPAADSEQGMQSPASGTAPKPTPPSGAAGNGNPPPANSANRSNPVDPRQLAAAQALAEATRRFANAQQATGEAAAELSGQDEIANLPLRRALEMAAKLPGVDPAGSTPGHESMSTPAESGSDSPSTSAAQSNSANDDSTNSSPSGTSSVAATDPTRASPELGTGFVPQSPQVTARMMAGPEAVARARAALQSNSPSSANPSASNERRGPIDPFADSPRQSQRNQPSRDQASVATRDEQGRPTTNSSANSPRENQGVRDGRPDAQSQQRGDNQPPGQSAAAGTEAPPAREFQEEAWFAKLPPELRQAIRAGARQRSPRAYEDRLRKYFQSID